MTRGTSYSVAMLQRSIGIDLRHDPLVHSTRLGVEVEKESWNKSDAETLSEEVANEAAVCLPVLPWDLFM